MRIVQVANFYGPRSGGLRTAVDQLGAGYVARGHEVTVIVPGDVHSETMSATGVHRIAVPSTQLPMTGGYRVARPSVTADVAASLRPDVLEISDRLTLRGLGTWARHRGIRSVMISHERLDRLLGQVLPVPVARAAADVANRRSVLGHDAVVCTTAFAQEEFDRIGADAHRIALGVDLELFHPSRRHRNEGRMIRLVHCGRLSVEKHAERSVDALAHLRREGIDARLVVVGDGPRRAALERRAEGLPVHFAGFVSDRERVARLLAEADVAVAPGPHETFGLAALEALASGTPAVVSGTSALAEIVTPDCGAAVANRSRDFAEGIATTLALPSGGRPTARARAEQYGWPTAVESMLAVLSGR
ncbi:MULTISPECIES: glycosyltransferase [Nocardiaceae]|uniref:Alpha-1,6-mannosyltransferase n=1 Tax=Rhodococcoides corynebacterioides TaxID=53972 RepID=A0ABS2KYG1_9NOCA|nr:MULTISPECIES: glycosyltransferase [Rhodococcus]MBM7416947.1 alpha-1,6-mannosyltransferase [Rhodococcus corynebacterioides]MBP1115200.1 alpha-1,6-mannosyltransferase [Rhodococcus sp. PvP016]